MKVNLFLSEPWKAQCAPFQMAPHVWYVGSCLVGSYLIDTGDGLLLLDQGYAEHVYQLLEAIRQTGHDPRDIRALLLSHAHVDHCGGTRLLKEYTGAPVYLSREDWEMYRSDPSLVHLDHANFIDFVPDRFYEEGFVQMGSVRIETVRTPGHTPGTVSFFWRDTGSDGRVYDLGLYGGLGLNTQQPDFLARHPNWSKDLLNDFIASLCAVQDRPVDIVLPSHPNHIDIPLFEPSQTQDPADFSRFVDDTAWKRMIGKRLSMAQQMRRKREEGIE